ncbi:arginine repressor [Boudabousia tangfeifanii]|uniref:Arginine repressor n=1 Tax=Boudabousia tangfeifanii TaxID=1912795 RepID=A0A1D9MK65_9ACTO|nr:arginine repressor [Boudabousia tangfeifanii]AOZ72741.1 arginine repressor [Boudabousia tangfeifanii]
MGNYPMTKAGRLSAIRDFIINERVASQVELVDRLASLGFSVTQTTISRDLVELQAVRVRDRRGDYVYVIKEVLPVDRDDAELSDRLFKLAGELVVFADYALNQVVIRTHPGAAQFLASGIDEANDDRILGTIAGDDTVLVLCRSIQDAESFQSELFAVLGD